MFYNLSKLSIYVYEQLRYRKFWGRWLNSVILVPVQDSIYRVSGRILRLVKGLLEQSSFYNMGVLSRSLSKFYIRLSSHFNVSRTGACISKSNKLLEWHRNSCKQGKNPLII